VGRLQSPLKGASVQIQEVLGLMAAGSANLYPVLLVELGLTVGVMAAWEAGRHLKRSAAPAAAAEATASRGPLRARSFLRVALGAVWILDGLLQAQPGMPAGFAGGILAPAAAGQPGWLATLLHWEMGVWQAHPVHLTVATVLIQMGIGVAILAGGDSWVGRLGLRSSIVWGLAVWLMGEGLGGLLGPGASVISGAPGAVLAYVFAAGLLLAPLPWWESGRIRRVVEVAVGSTLLLGVLLQTIPGEGFWSSKPLSSMFLAMAATRQPNFLADPIRALAGWTAADPLLWNTLLIAAMAGLGVGFLLGGRSRALTAAAVVWLLFIWWFGQDFGTFGAGIATDPNLAPLLVVLLLTAQLTAAPGPRILGFRWPAAWRHPQLARELALAGLIAVAVGLLAGAPYLSLSGRHQPAPTATAAVVHTVPDRVP